MAITAWYEEWGESNYCESKGVPDVRRAHPGDGRHSEERRHHGWAVLAVINSLHLLLISGFGR